MTSWSWIKYIPKVDEAIVLINRLLLIFIFRNPSSIKIEMIRIGTDCISYSIFEYRVKRGKRVPKDLRMAEAINVTTIRIQPRPI